MKGKAGFTLMEIMVSLVLVGLIAGIAGTSVITATRSYLYARENDAIAQKAQLALGRLNRELTELSNVKDASSTCVVYEGPYGKRAIARGADSNAIYLFTGYSSNNCPASASAGDILVDGVQTFQILYNPNPSGTASLWSTAQSIRDLFAVRVAMELTRTDTGGTIPFYLTVSPRNNNNSGGAALPTTSNPPPEYSGRQCFVTTAAWGDANHPVVEALRLFRDRVLLQSAPGRALVRLYEDVGPSLAQAIEGRPVACLLVRLLVTPVAGFAVLALTCPLLIPLILFLSWGLALLAVRAMRRRVLPRLHRQRGAMLVTLIAALVIFSALGAVMIAMFGTSALSQASGNSTQRAYYMAESGFRYASGAYVNVTGADEQARESARDSLLETQMHGKTFSLASGDGGFRFDVYPYYYKVVEPTTTNVLKTRVTGGFPLDGANYNSGSWVKVTTKYGVDLTPVQIAGVSLHTYAGYNEVRFYTLAGTPWSTSIGEGSTVTPVAVPDRSTLTVTDSDGDGLIDYLPFVAGSGARAFPSRNGIFNVPVVGSADPKVLSYRELDVTNRRLLGVGDPNGLPLTSLTLLDPGSGTPTRFIELMKFIRLDSTGIYGQGTAAVERKVEYFIPIGYAKAIPGLKTPFYDPMQNFANWLTGDNISRIGTLTAGTSYGTTMKVSTPQTVYTYPGGTCLKYKEFQVGLNWSAAGIPIQSEWLRAGNYLSYDLEMKTFYTLISPNVLHALGLTFRLDEQGNALGFTYARGIPGWTAGCDNDGLPSNDPSNPANPGFLGNIPGYVNYTPVLLVWMKRYEKQETNLYVELSPHSVTPPATINDPPPVGRGTYAIISVNPEYFWTNGERVRFTNTGGALPPGIIPGKDYYIRKIVYNSNTYLFLFVNETAAVTFDPLWPGLVDITDFGTGTTTVIAQDPTFTKLAHQVLTSGNEYLGLIQSLSYLKSWATFMARVIEAPSVSFSGGGGVSGREILSGETVYQTADNSPGGTLTAIYRVARAPLYRDSSSSARNWTANSAQGVLLLERIQGNAKSDPSTSPFTAAAKIFVGDHPGGVWAATANQPGGDAVFRQRDNWFLFYVGDPGGNAPADVNPFNNFRGPILRNSVLWPPDNPQDTVINTDNFTLVGFSDYVNSSLACKVNGVDRTGDYCLKGFYSKGNTGSAGDVLRFASPDGVLFYTPSSGTTFPTSRAEVGLHAYGNDAQFTEFDDFALQFGPGYSITRKGFMMPVQQ